MIIDSLQNASRYTGLGKNLDRALKYLKTTDFNTMQPGRYVIDGDNMFAMVSEYETRDPRDERLEAHQKYIDVQYIVSGSELMGYSTLLNQQPSKIYNEEEDYMLFGDPPSFFMEVKEGMFTIFYPGDLHMPCIKAEAASRVKKVVMKVRIF